MRRLGSHTSVFAATAVLGALTMRPSVASAEIILHDADGWRFMTTGRVEAHYELIQGDGDPHSANRLIGGQIQDSSQNAQNKLFDSRIRSGFVGSQIGFGVTNKMTETLEAKAFVSIWLNGIDSSKGVPPQTKGVDAREAWGALAGSFGTFAFGRAFSIFGSASGEVNAYAYEYAVGNPCLAEASTIACGSVGAGPIYAGYNAQLRYITPRFAGFEVQLSLEDPSSLPDYQITPTPRVEGEVSYRLHFLSDGKVVLKGQTLAQQLAKVSGMTTEGTTAWGFMGAARLETGGLRVGGGAWEGKGMGTDTPFQQDDQGKPLAHDQPGGTDANGQPLLGDELRMFRGYFGNLGYEYRPSGTGAVVGGGAVFVQETISDAATPATSLIKQNVEGHLVITQRIHSVVLSAEAMYWKSEWWRGESQVLHFIGAGSTFVW
jgi:hypothetical protein